MDAPEPRPRFRILSDEEVAQVDEEPARSKRLKHVVCRAVHVAPLGRRIRPMQYPPNRCTRALFHYYLGY